MIMTIRPPRRAGAAPTRRPAAPSAARAAALAAIALVAAVAAPLRAQTFPTQDATIRRIYAVGMDSSRLEREAHVLFEAAPMCHARRGHVGIRSVTDSQDRRLASTWRPAAQRPGGAPSKSASPVSWTPPAHSPPPFGRRSISTAPGIA